MNVGGTCQADNGRENASERSRLILLLLLNTFRVYRIVWVVWVQC